MATKPIWAGKEALLDWNHAEVYFDGTFTEPQLNHPEGITFDKEGNIYCGGEKGEIFRIDKSGRCMEQIASTGGFVLGLVFDNEENLYACDIKHAAVFKLEAATGQLNLFANGDGSGRRMNIPNAPVVDNKNHCLYVSDSYQSDQAGPGIWRFDLAVGKGEMWYDEPLTFANGMALDPSHRFLYVAETFAKQISRIRIGSDGRPLEKETVVRLDALPDGLTLDDKGNLYISCYEPSLIYRWSEWNGLELLYYDPTAHTLCHPTNCAFRGNDLFTSNLGRWHITRIPNVI